MNKEIKKWIDENININLEKKNIFITGSNSGIGYELLKELIYLKANCFMLCRNVIKANKAKEEVLKEYPYAKIEIIELNLFDFDSINKAVDKIKKYDVDCFINNAGIYRINNNVNNEYEITMMTNFIGPFYMNELLNEYFLSLNHKVINIISTSVASKISKIDYNDFFALRINNLTKRYGRSKLAVNNMYFYFLEKYNNSNIIFNLIHPGIVYTPLINKAYKNKIIKNASEIFMKFFFHKPNKAALTYLYSLKFNNNIMVGPRGLFEFSGFPKKVIIKQNKYYMKTIDQVKEIIKKNY